MPYDSNGNYTLPSVYKATPGTTIMTEQHNTPLEDVQSALNKSFLRDGTVPFLANVNANGFRVTSLANGVDNGDAANISQLKSLMSNSALTGNSTCENLTVSGSAIVPSVTDWTKRQAVGASDSDGRYLRQGGQSTNGTYQATGWTSRQLNGSTNTGSAAWGGLVSSAIDGRGTAGLYGPVLVSLCAIETVGSSVGASLQTQGYGTRTDFNFYCTGENAGRIIGGGNLHAWVSDVAAARTALDSAKVNRSGDNMSGALSVQGMVSASNGFTSSSHFGSDGQGQGRWGGYFTSSISGSPANIAIYTFETVGTTFGLDIQLNYQSSRSDFKLYQSGDIESPRGKVAFLSDLPIDASRRIVSFQVGSTANNTRINFPSSFSSSPEVLVQCRQGGGGQVIPVDPAYIDTGGFTLNTWSGQSTPALTVIVIGNR